MKYLWIALLSTALAGCASIPISTMARLSTLDQHSLAAIDGSEIRVRVAVPEGFEVDTAGTRLQLTLGDNQAHAVSRELALRSLSQSRGRRSFGIFSGSGAVKVYELALTPEAVARLSEVQRFAMRNQLASFKFAVDAKLAVVPADAKSLRIWTDLKLHLADPYMSLVDGAEITLNRN